MDADLVPKLPNDSLVWGGVQQTFIASFTCLALIVAEGVGVHAHSLVVNLKPTKNGAASTSGW
jgi:hypothetical protein